MRIHGTWHTYTCRYKAFLDDPRTHVEWGNESPSSEYEPVSVRVDHLIHLIVRTIQRGKAAPQGGAAGAGGRRSSTQDGKGEKESKAQTEREPFKQRVVLSAYEVSNWMKSGPMDGIKGGV